MRSHHQSDSIVRFAVLTISAALFAGGCASKKPPQRYPDGVVWTSERTKVRDAKTQLVAGRPGLRMDPVLLDRLNVAMKQQDLSEAKSQAKAVIEDAHAVALQSTSNEMSRWDDAAWRNLARQYYGADIAVDDTVKQQLAEGFKHETDLQVWFLQRRVDEARDAKQLRAVLAELRKQTQESVKTAGRASRSVPYAIFALPSKIAQNSVHENEAKQMCYQDGKFESVVIFAPPEQPTEPAGRNLSPSDSRYWNALTKYAPVFVQEKKSKIAYPAEDDLIGEVKVANDAAVSIDTRSPIVYGYTRTVLLGDEPHVQLIYAIWYPAHPKLRDPVDPEAGHIDGATIRITLDSQLRPATCETLNNCGCHHRIYASRDLEELAKREHGEPPAAKGYSLERDVKGKYDLIFPKLIDPGAGAHPFVRCRAGSHAIVDVDFVNRRPNEPVSQTVHYALRSYDELEQLRTPDGRTVSMFLDNGLVRGAERLEGAIFTPLGMLSAGQPRQRGTQLINWDRFDFDDPRLLEHTLRLPKSF